MDRGEVVLRKGYGQVEMGKACDPEVCFQAASIGKSITGMAIMKLVEEGRLDLDADVNNYLDNSWKLAPRKGAEPGKRSLCASCWHTRLASTATGVLRDFPPIIHPHPL